MDEATFKSVNEAYEMLAGIRDAGGTINEKDLSYVVGLLHGTLGPFTLPPAAIERGKKHWWQKFTP